MERRTTPRRTVLQLVGGGLVALAGCGGDGGDGRARDETEQTELGTATATGTAAEVGEEEEGGQQGGDASLRAVHVSPDAAALAITVDGEPFLDDVSFGTVTDYQPVQAGQRSVTVRSTDSEDPLFDGEIEVESGAQTLVGFGEATGGDTSFDVTALVDADSPAGSGGARVRVFHAIPNAQNVTVTAGESVLARDLAFGDKSAYVAVEGRVDEIQFRPAPAGEATPATAANASDETPTGEAVEETETPRGDEQTEPIATFSPDLAEGGAYTLYATGYVDATGEQPDARLVTAADAATDGGTTGGDTAVATEGGDGNATGGNETGGNETGGNETGGNETEASG